MKKLQLLGIHKEAADIRSRLTKGKRRAPVKGGFYLVPGLENRVTNYLLPVDTVEDQAAYPTEYYSRRAENRERNKDSEKSRERQFAVVTEDVIYFACLGLPATII